MLLARATAREKEMAMRFVARRQPWRAWSANCSSRVCCLRWAGVLGCAVPYGGIKALAAADPGRLIPREAVIRLNIPVLLFSLAVALVTRHAFRPGPRAANREERTSSSR